MRRRRGSTRLEITRSGLERQLLEELYSVIILEHLSLLLLLERQQRFQDDFMANPLPGVPIISLLLQFGYCHHSSSLSGLLNPSRTRIFYNYLKYFRIFFNKTKIGRMLTQRRMLSRFVFLVIFPLL